eukprot:SAG22_NODE_116_length_19306_cov_247.696517_21_plen_76_part_00
MCEREHYCNGARTHLLDLELGDTLDAELGQVLVRRPDQIGRLEPRGRAEPRQVGDGGGGQYSCVTRICIGLFWII